MSKKAWVQPPESFRQVVLACVGVAAAFGVYGLVRGWLAEEPTQAAITRGCTTAAIAFLATLGAVVAERLALGWRKAYRWAAIGWTFTFIMDALSGALLGDGVINWESVIKSGVTVAAALGAGAWYYESKQQPASAEDADPQGRV